MSSSEIPSGSVGTTQSDGLFFKISEDVVYKGDLPTVEITGKSVDDTLINLGQTIYYKILRSGVETSKSEQRLRRGMARFDSGAAALSAAVGDADQKIKSLLFYQDTVLGLHLPEDRHSLAEEEITNIAGGAEPHILCLAGAVRVRRPRTTITER